MNNVFINDQLISPQKKTVEISMEKPIKVLQIIDNLGMGGAETWLMELLRYWKNNKNIRLDILMTGNLPGVFENEVHALGVTIHRIRYSRSNLARFFIQFRKLLLREKYDAIHDHNDYTSGIHFLGAVDLLPRIRVSHVHNPWLNIEVNYNISLIRKITAKVGKRLTRLFASHICGTSAEILNTYGFHLGLQQKPKISVVHCGIDVDKFNKPHTKSQDRISVLNEFNWPQDSRIILFAGRLDQAMQYDHPANHKNSWLALNIIKQAHSMDRRICLVMAGAGDQQRKELETVINEWGSSEIFRLVGIRKDIDRLMRASDLLLFPSRQEGLGMVAVEAQACGLPVLASENVPRECIVVQELYNTLDLKEPIEVWSHKLLEILEKPKPEIIYCGTKVKASSFAIERSALSLFEIYSGQN